MRDKIHERKAFEFDANTRQWLIKQMERRVTVEIADRDYRTVSMPCLPLDASIKHWR